MVPDKTHRAVCAEVVRLLAEERKRQGITKYALAQRSGLSEQSIGYIERGLRQPYLETIVRISSGLEVDLGEIMKRAFENVGKST